MNDVKEIILNVIFFATMDVSLSGNAGCEPKGLF